MKGLIIGERTALHVNLNKQCISAKQGSGSVVHLEGVTLELRDVTWSCPRKGFETATKQRHVFAKMRGVLVAIHEGNTVPFDAPRVRLNSKERSDMPWFHTMYTDLEAGVVQVERVDHTLQGWLKHEMGDPYPMAYGQGF